MGTVTTLKAANEATRYVRVTERDHRGYVEFQFSIGDPNLYLEMTLPPAAFNEFCRDNAVTILSDAEGAAVDQAERRWRYGDEDPEEDESL